MTPAAAENETLLRHSVAHETTHFRHGDHIWALLRGLCLALHWYNPLVWLAAVLSRRDAELACDEATIQRMGESERTEYGRTLIGLTCQKPTALLRTATTMTGSKRGIRERITLLAKKPKMAICTLIAVLLIAAVAVGCTFTGAKEVEPSAAPAPTRAPQSAPEITMEVSGSIPQAALDYAADYTQTQLLYYTDDLGYEITEAKIVGLTRINTGTAGQYNGLDLYRLEYRFLAANPDAVMLVGGMRMEEDSITEWGSTGQPYLLLRWEDGSGGETVWQRVCAANTDVITQEYGTPEMLAQYGDMYIAAAMELYQRFLAPPSEPGGRGDETKTFQYGNLTLEITNVCDVRTESRLAEGIEPYSATTFLCRPGATLTVINADLSDPAYTADRKAHPQWGLYDAAGTRTDLSDAMAPILLGETTQGVANLESGICVLSFECTAVRPADLSGVVSATLDWNGVQTITDPADLARIEGWLSGSTQINGGAACWFTGLLTLEMENGKRATVSMATDTCGTWMSEGVCFRYAGGNEGFYAMFSAKPIHDAAQKGMEAVLPLLYYMDWTRYAQRYGTDETFALMDLLRGWAAEAGLSESERISRFMSVMSCTRALDGAYADYYCTVLGDLYAADPLQFAWSCLGNLNDEAGETVLSLLSHDLGVRAEEARAMLEAELG